MNGVSDLNLIALGLVAAALVFVMALASILTRRRPGKLSREKYNQRWQEVQALCADKGTWPLAIINADKLLDDALRTLKYKGKTMGERMVAAQRDLSDNDGAWFAHKLRNRLVHEHVEQLSKDHVQQALRGFRQALKDLGAL